MRNRSRRHGYGVPPGLLIGQPQTRAQLIRPTRRRFVRRWRLLTFRRQERRERRTLSPYLGMILGLVTAVPAFLILLALVISVWINVFQQW
jgi:hypothetical protein